MLTSILIYKINQILNLDPPLTKNEAVSPPFTLGIQPLNKAAYMR
ncbi:hypothetical protein BN1044_02079 [Hafnia alvei]|uniref:Uncharacterized protein n=1 Tax=Hafnia alvei TaxID=569 RepID=A0A1C6Z0R2_HAFAL|nr:hypothetical protein BN1044_02079 [Hafnia alvei]